MFLFGLAAGLLVGVSLIIVSYSENNKRCQGILVEAVTKTKSVIAQKGEISFPEACWIPLQIAQWRIGFTGSSNQAIGATTTAAIIVFMFGVIYLRHSKAAVRANAKKDKTNVSAKID